MAFRTQTTRRAHQAADALDMLSTKTFTKGAIQTSVQYRERAVAAREIAERLGQMDIERQELKTDLNKLAGGAYV